MGSITDIADFFYSLAEVSYSIEGFFDGAAFIADLIVQIQG
ncbi:hypothetical protein [Lolliginicoccus suaedae]|nr:hypothetical protein [Lolliginicoccus suaedae]